MVLKEEQLTEKMSKLKTCCIYLKKCNSFTIIELKQQNSANAHFSKIAPKNYNP